VFTRCGDDVHHFAFRKPKLPSATATAATIVIGEFDLCEFGFVASPDRIAVVRVEIIVHGLDKRQLLLSVQLQKAIEYNSYVFRVHIVCEFKIDSRLEIDSRFNRDSRFNWFKIQSFTIQDSIGSRFKNEERVLKRDLA
jgi:hypothetical protein